MNAEGNIVQFNKAAQDITGYTFTEVNGRNLIDVLTPGTPNHFLLLNYFLNRFLTEEERPEQKDQFHRLVSKPKQEKDLIMPAHENVRVWWRTKSGELALIKWNQSAITNSQGAAEWVHTRTTLLNHRNRYMTSISCTGHRHRSAVEQGPAYSQGWVFVKT